MYSHRKAFVATGIICQGLLITRQKKKPSQTHVIVWCRISTISICQSNCEPGPWRRLTVSLEQSHLICNKICRSQSRRLNLYGFSFVYHNLIVMEHQQDSSLFGMNVDQVGKSHLADAARWAKFLSIMGFIGCGLVVLIGVFFGSIFGILTTGLERNSPYGNMPNSAPFGAAMAFIYIIIALIYFFPCLFLFRFASKM